MLPYWKLAGRATDGVVTDGVRCGTGELTADDLGTCWNALVTSCKDMRDGAADIEGGGVSPSSDLTS